MFSPTLLAQWTCNMCSVRIILICLIWIKLEISALSAAWWALSFILWIFVDNDYDNYFVHGNIFILNFLMMYIFCNRIFCILNNSQAYNAHYFHRCKILFRPKINTFQLNDIVCHPYWAWLPSILSMVEMPGSGMPDLDTNWYYLDINWYW